MPPSPSQSDAFHRFHHNPDGLVQRDAISCRTEHQASTMGDFVPGFSIRTGNPIARVGYHVPCQKDSDCYRKCPRHPLTGSFYRCVKVFQYFDTVNTSSAFFGPDADYINISSGTSASFDVEIIVWFRKILQGSSLILTSALGGGECARCVPSSSSKSFCV